MAEACNFEESNFMLSRPPDMTADECDPLCVWLGKATNGLPYVFSCWKLTVEELAEINKTGRVWLGVLGNRMPPVTVSTISPFKPE